MQKRKRREYRLSRKAQFARPEPGFSLYEGRTRGKRMRYTFSEDEEDYSDAISTRRSTRNTGTHTPADPSKPTVTASGRQVRSRLGGAYGESLLSGQNSDNRASPASGDYERSEPSEDPEVAYKRPTRGGKPMPGWKGWAIGYTKAEEHIDGYNEVDAMDEDEDEAMSSGESGEDWDGGEEDDDVIRVGAADDEDEEDMSDGESDDNSPREPKSLIVTLRYGMRDNAVKSGSPPPPTTASTMPIPQQSSMPQTGNSAPRIKLDSPIVDSPMIKSDSHHSPLPSRIIASPPTAGSVPPPFSKPNAPGAPTQGIPTPFPPQLDSICRLISCNTHGSLSTYDNNHKCDDIPRKRCYWLSPTDSR